MNQKLPILIVWIIVSLIILIVILISFFIDRQIILKIIPTCISKRQFNTECSFCGMSRAFIEISNGKLKNAYNLNKGSIYLYSVLLLNSIIFIMFSLYFINSKLNKPY